MESARFLIKDIMRPFSKIRTAQFVEALERRVHLTATPFNTKSIQGASSQFMMRTALSQEAHGLMNHLIVDVTDVAGHITTVAVDDQTP